MRVPIAHDLTREEVRRRLHKHSHRIAEFIPGGMAEVSTDWPHEDRMTLGVKAMGQGIDGAVIIEDTQVIFEVNLPMALSFVEPIISGAIREHGQKLLAPKKD